jgi:hypothetical protein
LGNETTTQNQSGTQATTGTGSQTSPQWLQNIAQGNAAQAASLQRAGAPTYTGQFVAPFSSQQAASFGYGSDIANATEANLAPSQGALTQAIGTAGNAPTVSANSISSQMSPYMNQYVNLALAPQLQQAANTYMQQSQAQQGAATSAGAFGDPRANLLQSNLGLNYSLENQGLVGNAYNAAFNTAIGAGAQDVSNQLAAQQANAGIWSNQIGNLINASNAGFGQNTAAANLENTFGAQQTAASQANLNALYNQYVMNNYQYPFMTQQNVGSAIGSALPTNVATANTGNGSTTGFATVSQPNNALWGVLGAALGAGGSALGGALKPPSVTNLNFGQGLAEGGEPPVGEVSMVGEEGPELFVPKTAGTIIPYDHLRKLMAQKKNLVIPRSNFGIAA